MGVVNAPTTHYSATNPAIPGICKVLIGQSVARLRSCNGTEESLADKLVFDLNRVYKAVQTISNLYDGLDDDGQDNGEF